MRFALVALLLAAPARAADPPWKPTPADYAAAAEYTAIREGWDAAVAKHGADLRAAKTDAERAAVKEPDPKPFVARCRKLADSGLRIGAAARFWIADHAPGTPDAARAVAELRDGPLKTDGIGALWSLFFNGNPGPGARELAPDALARAVREPDHPKTADLLVRVCKATAGADDPAAVRTFRAAADLLSDRYPDGLYVWDFVKLLPRHPNGAWAEARLRAVLAKTTDPANRLRASAALAGVLRDKDAESQPEAIRLLGHVADNAEAVSRDWNKKTSQLRESVLLFPHGDIMAKEAKAEIEGIRKYGLGLPAPDLAGDDLDGRPLRLKDHRGEVVLVTFWAAWCDPCLALVPTEVALAKRLAGEPFTIVGVNVDDDAAAARKAAADKGIPWRSLRDRRGEDGVAERDWGVSAWPTLVLVDRAGVIRKRWSGTPPAGAVDREVDHLLAAGR